MKLSEASKLYLDHCELEKEMSPASIYEYVKTIKWTIDSIGDLEIGKINEEHIAELKKEYNRRELMPATKIQNQFQFMKLKKTKNY